MRQNILAAALWLAAASIVLPTGASAETLDQNAQAALDAGDTAAAVAHIEKAIQTDPTYHYNYHVLGLISCRRGDFRKALGYFQSAVEKKKKHYESLFYLGQCQLQVEDLDGAQKSFAEGLKKAREMKDRFEYGMGLVFMARKEYQEADRSLRRAVAADSTRAEYHIALGDVNFYQGVPALAVSEYEIAHALDTAGTEVYFHWAEACLENKDYTCAIDKLRIVLSRDSTFAPAWNRAGGIYFKAGLSSRVREDRLQRFADAIGSYERYIQLANVQPDSTTVRAFFETAMAYANIFRYEEALPYFEKVLAIPYEPRDIYFHYGKALWGVKQYDRAAELMEKHEAWAASQDDNASRVDQAELYKILGDCYFYSQPKRYSEAVGYYRKSLDADANQPRVLQNLAVALHTLERYGEAMHYYELRKAAGVDSASATILKNASLCALRIAGDESGAMDDEGLLEEDQAAAGSVVDTFTNPSLNYYQVAVDYMKQYLNFMPNDTSTYERLANTYLYQLQDCANGVAACERVLALDPNNCQAKKSIGFAYFTGSICGKDLSKTLKYMLQAQECLSAKGPCTDVALMTWIAQAYHLRAVAGTADANSDYKNAFEWYGRVLKCDPNNAEARKGADDTQFEFN
ncbi:MAG: tetratricopeptide repeat protein [Candidatus Zixiibacteriota bacterium]